MTIEEAKSFIIDISYKLGNMSVEYLTEKDGEKMREAIEVLEQEQKTGHWIRISPAGIYECSECGQNVMTSDILAYRFCHGCGVKMIAESEEV